MIPFLIGQSKGTKNNDFVSCVRKCRVAKKACKVILKIHRMNIKVSHYTLINWISESNKKYRIFKKEKLC